MTFNSLVLKYTALVSKNFNKDFVVNFFNFLHLYTLHLIFFVISLTSIFFFLNITFENFKFYRFFYILISILPLVIIFFSTKKFNFFKIIIYFIFYLFFVLLSCTFAEKFLELTPDGLSYQLKISYYLANGYNPFYDFCGSLIGERNLDFIKFFNLPSASHQYTSHSIHFFENFFYNITNESSVDVFKAGKILILLATIFPILEILRISGVKKFKYWITLLIIFNPIIFNQLFNAYKDIYGYYFFIFAIYYFILLYTNIKFKEINFYLFLMSVCIFSSPKMNFFFFAITFFLVFSFILFQKFKEKKILVLAVLLPISALFLFSYTPTAKSYIYQEIIQKKINNNPLPPCFEKEFVTPFSPPTDQKYYVNNTNPISVFIKSLFLKASKDDFEHFDKKRANNLERLFTIKKHELRNYITVSTPMVGSAGPLFGLAFLSSIFFIILKKIKLKHIKIDEYYIEILSIILFLVILIFPYPIFYRFIPFVWIIPILLMISLFSKNFNFLGSVIGLILSINVLIVSVLNVSIIVPTQIMLREQVKFYYTNLNKNDEINIYLSNWEAVLFSIDRITNFAITNKKIKVNKIGPNDKICKKKYFLYFTEAHLCLNESHDKKFKEYEKTLHKILPPYLFFRSFLNL